MSGRCRSCDARMSDADMKRKHAVTGEYLDLCSRCLADVNSIVVMPFNGAPLENYKSQPVEVAVREVGENYE